MPTDMQQMIAQEILEAIHLLAEQMDDRFNRVDEKFKKVDERFDKVEERFEKVDKRFEKLEGRMDRLENRLDGVENRLEHIEGKVGGMESQMVTKAYLDGKLADFKSELISLSRKTNTKLSVLVERLVAEGSLQRPAADQILALEPFPQ